MAKNKKLGTNYNSNNPVKRANFATHNEELKDICNVSIDWITITGTFLERSARKELLSIGWVVTKIHENKYLRYELQEKTENPKTHKIDIKVKASLFKNQYQDTWSMKTSNHLTRNEKTNVLKAISYMIDKRITRLDLAIDFINFDDSGMHYRFYKTGTSKTIIQGANGKYDTFYCGSSTSSKQYRYYNKLKERKSNNASIPKTYYSWERLELTTKNNNWVKEFITMLTYFKKPKYADNKYKGLTKIILIGLVEHPELIDELTGHTKIKYKNLLEQGNFFDTRYPDIAKKVFNAKIDDLRKEIESFIA